MLEAGHDLAGIENVAQPVKRRVPLAERLVDDAAAADLVLELLVLFAPVELLDGIAEDADSLLALDEWA